MPGFPILKKYKLRLIPTAIILFAFLTFIVLFNNKKNISRAFYYWKTDFSLSQSERLLLENLNVKKLYVKFLDVDWDGANNRPVPVAQIKFTSPTTQFEIIPVVFITNKTIINSSDESIPKLVRNISNNIKAIAARYNFSFKEIQLDCDWTLSTKEKYFNLISQMKSFLKDEKIIISATIRLHQIKYYTRTGIPPADRGMLMFYNMGKIDSSSGTNSIFDEHEAAKYSNYIRDYPLPLDAALPIFSWVIHLRNGKPIGTLDKSSNENIRRDKRFVRKSKDYYVADSSFFFNGSYIKKNDILKIEETAPGCASSAATLLNGKLKFGDRAIALFDLDSINIAGYSHEELNELYEIFK